MSKERDLLRQMIDRDKLGLMINDLLGYAGKLLSEPEEKPAVIVDAEYIAASIEFMNNQKADDAKEMVRLRDWFAGLAMQGMIKHVGSHTVDCENIAWCAYEQSDAMLKERSKVDE